MTDTIGLIIGVIIGTIIFFTVKKIFLDKQKPDDLINQTQEVGSQWDYLKEN